jgi:Fur family transcriptional regulator, zinc uptake regulator
MPEEPHLTDNQSHVLKHLRATGRALSAYEILDLVRDDGLRAPAQVYRALEKLIETGLVHRLESLNAFIACGHDHVEPETCTETVAFAICEKCGVVAEYEMLEEAAALRSSLGNDGFVTGHMTIEVRGRCADCAG